MDTPQSCLTTEKLTVESDGREHAPRVLGSSRSCMSRVVDRCHLFVLLLNTGVGHYYKKMTVAWIKKAPSRELKLRTRAKQNLLHLNLFAQIDPASLFHFIDS
jgi:hypothetical protein